MSTVTFDETRWPLVLITYAKNTTEADFHDHLRLLDLNICRAQAERRQTAIIYDLSSGYQAPPSVRKAQAEWMKNRAGVARANCCGIAFVITSVFVRGALTAILWLSDMPCAYTVVATVEEAERWCRPLLLMRNGR